MLMLLHHEQISLNSFQVLIITIVIIIIIILRCCTNGCKKNKQFSFGKKNWLKKYPLDTINLIGLLNKYTFAKQDTFLSKVLVIIMNR